VLAIVIAVSLFFLCLPVFYFLYIKKWSAAFSLLSVLLVWGAISAYFALLDFMNMVGSVITLNGLSEFIKFDEYIIVATLISLLLYIIILYRSVASHKLEKSIQNQNIE